MTRQPDAPDIDPGAAGLLAEIVGARVPAGTLAMWWLGQEGWIIRGGGLTLVIDAFLSDFGSYGRAYPPPLDPGALTGLDLVIGTHNHVDHIDPIGFPRMMDASPQALGIVPQAVKAQVVAMDVAPDRLRGAVADKVIEHLGVRITPIPAVHADRPLEGYDFYLDEEGQHTFLGYIFEIDGVRFCHVGDTLPYEGLVERLQGLELDLLMVPINGRSWFREVRGFAGNMNVFEAAEFAELVRPRLTIPMHHDMFPVNAEHASHFIEYTERYHPGVMTLVPVIGRRIDLVAGH